jgi:fructokinase
MTSPRIISFGEVLWDIFPDGEKFGGAPANFACHAAILGAKVSMVTALGNDRRGQLAINTLEGYGIDTELIQISPNTPTGIVQIELDAFGKPEFTIQPNSAWETVVWNSNLAECIPNADAVYFGTLGQHQEPARSTIHEALDTAARSNVTRIVDINLRAPFFNKDTITHSIMRANLLKLSDEELPHVCKAFNITPQNSPETCLQRIKSITGLEGIVMTCGAQGAILVSANGTVNQPGFPTEVKDTVGAGDSFAAAFLMGWLQGQPDDQILHRACAVAATTCSHWGAVPTLPD